MSATRQEVLALALGQLSSEDQQRVGQALDHDPALRTALRRDLDALTSLLADLDVQAQSVPAGADLRLLERVRAETAASQRATAPSASPAVPAVAPAPAPPARVRAAGGRLPDPSWALPALLALGVALVLGFALRPAGDAASRYAAAPDAQLEAVYGPSGAVARLVRLDDGRVYVRMDRPLEARHIYQLWRLLPGPANASLPRSLGLFASDVMTHPMPQQAVLAVSVEPPGGSTQPSTPLLFKFRLR